MAVAVENGASGRSGTVTVNHSVDMANHSQESQGVVIVLDEEAVDIEEDEKQCGNGQHSGPCAVAAAANNGTSGMVTVDENSVVDVNRLNLRQLLANNQWSSPPEEEKGIVLEEEDVARFKRSAHLFFEKYMEHGTPLEINISHELSSRYHALENMDYAPLRPMEWIKLYDEVLTQLEQYVVQSYTAMIEHLHKIEKEK